MLPPRKVLWQKSKKNILCFNLADKKPSNKELFLFHPTSSLDPRSHILHTLAPWIIIDIGGQHWAHRSPLTVLYMRRMLHSWDRHRLKKEYDKDIHKVQATTKEETTNNNNNHILINTYKRKP